MSYFLSKSLKRPEELEFGNPVDEAGAAECMGLSDCRRATSGVAPGDPRSTVNN